MDRDPIKEDIKAFAPYLMAIKKTNCYRVPADYFEQLKLKETVSNKNDYSLPEGYFDKMQQEVQEQLGTGDTSKKGSIYRKILPWSVGIAASLLLVISIQLSNDKTLVTNDLSQEIYDEEILYLSDHLEDFALEDLIGLEDIDTGSLDDLETELIEDYIQNNLEDFELDDLESLL